MKHLKLKEIAGYIRHVYIEPSNFDGHVRFAMKSQLLQSRRDPEAQMTVFDITLSNDEAVDIAGLLLTTVVPHFVAQAELLNEMNGETKH